MGQLTFRFFFIIGIIITTIALAWLLLWVYMVIIDKIGAHKWKVEKCRIRSNMVKTRDWCSLHPHVVMTCNRAINLIDGDGIEDTGSFRDRLK